MILQPLVLAATESTPHILFDPARNIFEIKGESRPENAKAFYDPVIDWVKNFCSGVKDDKLHPAKLIFVINFDYFSSSSAKYLMNIFARLEELHKNKIQVEAKWYYNEVDIAMKESGEEFKKLLTLPFSFELLRH